MSAEDDLARIQIDPEKLADQYRTKFQDAQHQVMLLEIALAEVMKRIRDLAQQNKALEDQIKALSDQEKLLDDSFE